MSPVAHKVNPRQAVNSAFYSTLDRPLFFLFRHHHSRLTSGLIKNDKTGPFLVYKAGVLSKDTEFTTNEFIESAGVPIIFGG